MTRVHVLVDLAGHTVPAGIANFEVRRGKLTTSFRYLDDYLADRRAYALDPALPLYRGAHHTAGLPGAFADAAPDRWGRSLIRKRVEAAARLQGRTPPALSDSDYLLSVSDAARQGALRFSEGSGLPYLADHREVPRLIELPRLLRAAERVAADENDIASVKDLLAAGSGSLGGARPKASIRDGEQLLIAKFPHPADEWNVMAWEKTALDLAEGAGIAVPSRTLVRVGGRSVLLLDRFDRAVQGERIGYISAMTLLESTDGEPRDYLEIAEVLPEYSAATAHDLAQLWRRIAFTVAVNNTDDHLRNLGFLAAKTGWSISPGFDINPNPSRADRRVTAIGGAYDRRDSLEALMMYRETFGLSVEEARTVLVEVGRATRAWRQIAAGNGIVESEIRRFEPALEAIRLELTPE